MTRLPTPPARRRPALPPACANIRSIAVAALLAAYPLFLSTAIPRATIQATEDGWIVTLWFHRHLYKRVAVGRDGRAHLLASEQAL